MSGTAQIVTRRDGQGATPLCVSALSNTLVLVEAALAVPPRHLGLYGCAFYNPNAAVAYVQHFDPSVAGSLAAVAGLGSAGAQTGIVVTLFAGTLSNGNSLIVDQGDNSEVVTITALSGTGPYTVSFTTSKVHATSGTLMVAGGITLGTTVRQIALGIPGTNAYGLPVNALGVQFRNGLVVAATTTPTGSTALGTALVGNFFT